jgi:hypothetical protein
MTNNEIAKQRLISLGADALADLILDSLTPAGAISEWDSETIEEVLSPYEAVLKKLDLPWIGDTGSNDNSWKFWAEIADERGIETDFEVQL